ncbi:hypothetical protein [Actinomadura rifamycini]|uniref:hypothetical protein n=1 Tax=Actinomadura rifamycini TaxID=31962 RepID=UPI000478961B|nr:hypothetical protein [Actinomadura rifamycini]
MSTSAEGRAVVERITGPDVPAADRAAAADEIAAFTDARVGRYWTLLAVIAGQEPTPPAVPAFEWFIAALRAHSG